MSAVVGAQSVAVEHSTFGAYEVLCRQRIVRFGTLQVAS